MKPPALPVTTMWRSAPPTAGENRMETAADFLPAPAPARKAARATPDEIAAARKVGVLGYRRWLRARGNCGVAYECVATPTWCERFPEIAGDPAGNAAAPRNVTGTAGFVTSTIKTRRRPLSVGTARSAIKARTAGSASPPPSICLAWSSGANGNDGVGHRPLSIADRRRRRLRRRGMAVSECKARWRAAV